MFAHIIRIDPDWLRLPLLLVWWPFVFLEYLGRAALPRALGGHPNKRRFLDADFYALPIDMFLAAWDGAFVPR